MSYRNIVVFLDQSPASQVRLGVALNLAAEHDAVLTGLYLDYIPFSPDVEYVVSGSQLEKYQADLKHHQHAAEQQFNAAALKATVRHTWVYGYTYETKQAIAFCRSADLIVVGQYDPDQPIRFLAPDFIPRILLGAARPVLVVPYHNYLVDQTYRHVLIAWNGSRDAARAIADALPMLRFATRITLLSIGQQADPFTDISTLPKPDIKAYLHQHMIRAELVEKHISVSALEWLMSNVGDWILEQALALDRPTDLIIAGAYGHSRLDEYLLGGVTHTLLDRSDIPLLLSH
jgi:nucleotide-binding universal stress UspA family protein